MCSIQNNTLKQQMTILNQQINVQKRFKAQWQVVTDRTFSGASKSLLLFSGMKPCLVSRAHISYYLMVLHANNRRTTKMSIMCPTALGVSYDNQNLVVDNRTRCYKAEQNTELGQDFFIVEASLMHMSSMSSGVITGHHVKWTNKAEQQV